MKVLWQAKDEQPVKVTLPQQISPKAAFKLVFERWFAMVNETDGEEAMVRVGELVLGDTPDLWSLNDKLFFDQYKPLFDKLYLEMIGVAGPDLYQVLGAK